ncbi:hypothetical protein D3C81_1907000 [compost metagenome]
MIPVFVVAFFPAAVRYDDHRDVERANGAIKRAQVVEQADLLGHWLDQGVDLSALRQKVVVGVDQQIGSPVKRVGGVGHDGSPQNNPWMVKCSCSGFTLI